MKQIIDFFRNLGGKNNFQSKEPTRVIHPEHIFLSVIRRETSRYNRNKRPFSVIAIDLSTFDGNPRNINAIKRKLASRLRISDDLGWLGENTIGLLLAETDPDGTDALVQSLFDNDYDFRSETSMTIYHYPSPDWPEMFL